MTSLLKKAFEAASKLAPAEQDVLASRVLAEIADDDEFDRRIADTAGRLADLSEAALAEFRAGLTENLPPERR